jgi:hypothetical protein
MSNTGNKLVLAFNHAINAEEVTLYRNKRREGNTLNQIGQVMDGLIQEERKRCVEKLLELVPMCDPDLTREYLHQELMK